MPVVVQNNYGCFSFLLDIFMTMITGGLWLIWVIIRQSRKTRVYY